MRVLTDSSPPLHSFCTYLIFMLIVVIPLVVPQKTNLIQEKSISFAGWSENMITSSSWGCVLMWKWNMGRRSTERGSKLIGHAWRYKAELLQVQFYKMHVSGILCMSFYTFLAIAALVLCLLISSICHYIIFLSMYILADILKHSQIWFGMIVTFFILFSLASLLQLAEDRI